MKNEIFYSRAFVDQSFRAFHGRKRTLGYSASSRGEPALFTLFQNFETLIPYVLRAVRQLDYELSPAVAHVISADKERIIHHFNWLDTFLLFHLARFIEIKTAPVLSESVFSYRKGRSAALALSRLCRFLKKSPDGCAIVRRDIKSFGESMQHNFILDDFRRVASVDEGLNYLMKQICNFRCERFGKIIENQRGLPGGHHIQLVCENLYLLELDRALEKLEPGCYLRFGDDILFASPDFSLADRAGGLVQDFLAKRGVSTNVEKSRDLVLGKPQNASLQGRPTSASIKYLGSEVHWDGSLSIPARKLKPLRKLLVQRIEAACQCLPVSCTNEHRLEIAVCAVRNLVARTDAAMSKDNPLSMLHQEAHNPNQLRELDRWLALVVLRATFRRGFSKGNFRRCGFSKLRSLGLPSLSHLRRTNGFY